MAVKKYRARRFRRYERRRRRRSRMASMLALLVIVAGLGLLGYALLGENSPFLKAISNASKDEEEEPASVKDTKLKLTVPAMARVQDLNVTDAPYDDESSLDDGAQHVQGTGFPWEEESNVYIAGHRLGYLGTDSYLVFYDLDKVEEGDEIFLTDSDGTRYTYEVFENFIADPYDWSVTEPISGKNIVTLQTCTLPDYSQRVIVQGELTKVEPGQGVEEEQDEPDEPDIPEDQLVPADLPPDGAAPIETLPDVPPPIEPVPGEPAPVDSVPVNPVPDQPAPVEPAAPVEPVPVEPAPIQPPAQAA
jgi:sortase A